MHWSIVAGMTGEESGLSIVVPAYREGPNIRELALRVFTATREAGINAEIIIVDDNSQDETKQVADELARDWPVTLLTRTDERGLSTAVLHGFRHAQHDRLLVMDGDLQHPPEMVPQLAARLDDPEVDFVIGTRYGEGGEVVGEWPWLRRLGSRVATAAARPLAPLSDPLSGFFAIRRERWKGADRINPIGYKIALELYVKAGCRAPAEVPIRFGVRSAGRSKMTSAVFLRYLQHLVSLYRFRFPYAFWGATVLATALLLAFGLYLFRR
ncbi:MAG: polyprenol monophosphomannose synthase [Planctomycetota bacterium]